MALSSGDIYLVNFNPTKGTEVGKYRPAIIVSKTEDNEILETVIVVPLSTQIVPDAFPYRLKIPKRGNLQKDSDACIYEIKALSKLRIQQKIASVTDQEIVEIKSALNKILH